VRARHRHHALPHRRVRRRGEAREKDTRRRGAAAAIPPGSEARSVGESLQVTARRIWIRARSACLFAAYEGARARKRQALEERSPRHRLPPAGAHAAAAPSPRLFTFRCYAAKSGAFAAGMRVNAQSVTCRSPKQAHAIGERLQRCHMRDDAVATYRGGTPFLPSAAAPRRPAAAARPPAPVHQAEPRVRPHMLSLVHAHAIQEFRRPRRRAMNAVCPPSRQEEGYDTYMEEAGMNGGKTGGSQGRAGV